MHRRHSNRPNTRFTHSSRRDLSARNYVYIWADGVYLQARMEDRRPQSNGIVERFHRTLLDEHFRVEGRRTWFETIEEMQAVLDKYLVAYNQKRPHQGRNMNGRTPAQAFVDGLPKSKQQKGEQKGKKTIQKQAA